MPWEKTSVLEQRICLVMSYLGREAPMAVLCRRHGVSRKTGYKWVELYRSLGLPGLDDRPRRPRSGKHWTRAETQTLIITMRRKHPRWGAPKIVARLRQLRRGRRLPAVSTAHDILYRAGLVKRRRVRVRWPRGTPRILEARRPNETWSVDFKGHFRLGNGRYCYVLTVLDSCTRYLLTCTGLNSIAFEEAWPVFETLFREYGLPISIYSDNGEPFASDSIAGISRLTVRLIRLGIRVDRARPSHPQDNGRHERMHRTLKDEATKPPGRNLRAQQKQLDAFRTEYNDERPHEAIGQKQPGRLYRRSPRPSPEVISEIEYPGSFTIRRVRSDGAIKWHGKLLFISQVLRNERVGVVYDEGSTLIYFGPLLLGYIHEKRWKVLPTKTMKKSQA